jgi:hypothetical protein
MELCQFLGGDWKVIIAVQHHSQPPLTVRNRGGELFLTKKTPQLQWRGPKRQNKRFLENSKIPNCGPASSARELKKAMNVWT